jgi:hypothetical protein
VPPVEEDPAGVPPRTLRRWLTESRVVRASLRFLTDPAYRRLRWIIGIGLLVRLLLAPLTSWDYDTPGFVLSGISTIYTGNPYASSVWANPPLAPYVAAPFLAIPTLLFGPQSLVAVIPAIAPVSIATGVNATFVPSPAALLAWKLPFLLSDLGVAFLLLLLPRRMGLTLPLSREALVGLWFLNPLVIWASAVHGEVDSLAVLLLLLALYAVVTEHWFTAGLFVGLSVFTKAYPIVLLPVLAAAVLAWPGKGIPARRPLLGRSVRVLLGLAGCVLAFLPYLTETSGVLQSKASNPNYGGLSLLILYNRISPSGAAGLYSVPSFIPSGPTVLLLFRVMAIIAVVGGTGLFVCRLKRTPNAPRADRSRWLLLASLWGIVGVLLADSVPQPENVVAVLPILLLALPAKPSRGPLLLFALLSAAGATMYWAFLTPLAMMYPGALLFGSGAVRDVNGVVLGYLHAPTLHGVLMTGSGLVGGFVLLALWVLSGWQLIPESWRARVKGVNRGRTVPVPTSPV